MSKHHGRQETHAHIHGYVDPTILTTKKGIWATKWSLYGLLVTAFLQAYIVSISGSVALLADTIHNFIDAFTAIPLWIAFLMARWKPSKRYTYGYGRVEDLAGLSILFFIVASAVVACYESINRLIHPRPVEHLLAVVIASIIGFIGNELVAMFRIRVGKEIESAALVADGYHARIDGLTSLAVLFGAVGIWLGFPQYDPIVGLVITVMILRICWQTSKSVISRVLDGVDPSVIDEIRQVATTTEGVLEVTEVRARWLGHRLYAELNIAVDSKISVEQGHDISSDLRHRLEHKLTYLSNVTIHVDPITESGEMHHKTHRH